MKLPLSCRFILQWASSWGTSTCLPAQLRLQYSEHPAIPLCPGQTSELLSQAIPYCTTDCYWVWNKKTNPKQIKAIYTPYIYLLTCTSSRNEDKQSAVLRQTCEFQLNLCCKVWKSLSCIHFLLSFYNSMQKRIKPQKKGLVKQSYAMEWVNTKVSTGFSSYFSLRHVSKSHHLLTNKTEEEIFLSALFLAFHTCLPFLKCLALPAASSSCNKKRWSLSGFSRNNSWTSKWFVKTYVQNVPVYQGALGTESSVETWFSVAWWISYWVVISAVGRFYVYLCMAIRCIF